MSESKDRIVDYKSSLMMDRVLEFVKNIATTLIVKKQYMADREETVETRRNGDAYIDAIFKNDSFYTYTQFSQYAIDQAKEAIYEEFGNIGTLNSYVISDLRQKGKLTTKIKNILLGGQREFIINNYVEPNNYYRSLAGLPDITFVKSKKVIITTEGELKGLGLTGPITDPITLSVENILIGLNNGIEIYSIDDNGNKTLLDFKNYNNIIKDNIYVDRTYVEGVDITKPVHEMTNDECTILSVMGIIDELKEKYPDKLFLDHLVQDRRIPIATSREANDFDILYIYKDRQRQGISELFIALYRQARSYVLDTMYDEGYKKNSPYYDAFIGLFILVITIQRFIVQYFQKFINRDFFDKDLIRIFFESYGIPFYNDIPLSYLTNITKNLNRLLQFKSTDKVFVDIFKLFKMDNIDLSNLILFKDRKMNTDGTPKMVYQAITDLGTNINTDTYELIYNKKTKNKEASYLTRRLNYIDNIKKTIILYNKQEDGGYYYTYFYLTNDCKLYARNLAYTSEQSELWKYYKEDVNINETYIKFIPNKLDSSITAIRDIQLIESPEGNILLMKTNKPNILFYYSNDTTIGNYMVYKKELDIRTIDNTSNIRDILISKNRFDDTSVVAVMSETNNSYIYMKGTWENISYDEYTFVQKIENDSITNVSINDKGVLLTTTNNYIYAYGKNNNGRMLPSEEDYSKKFIKVVEGMHKALLYEYGSIYLTASGHINYMGVIPTYVDTPMASLSSSMDVVDAVPNYSNIRNINDLFIGDKIFHTIEYFNNTIDFFNYSYKDELGPLLFDEDVAIPFCKYHFIKDFVVSPDVIIVTTYSSDDIINYAGSNIYERYPFSKTEMLMNINNLYSITKVILYNNVLYFIDKFNRFGYFGNDAMPIYIKLENNDIAQNFYISNDKLDIFVGRRWYYQITKDDENFDNIIKVDPLKDITNVSNLITTESYTDYYGYVLRSINIDDGNKITEIELYRRDFNTDEFYNIGFNRFDFSNDIAAGYVSISYNDRNSNYDFYINLSKAEGEELEHSKELTIKGIDDGESIRHVAITDYSLIIDGKGLYIIDIENLKKQYAYAIAKKSNEISSIKIYSRVINGEMVTFDKTGGIILYKGFKHSKALEVDIEGDYIRLYPTTDTFILSMYFDDNDIIFIKTTNSVVTYKPVVKEMYDFHFVEVPMRCKNVPKYLTNSAYYQNYYAITNPDVLWFGDADREAYLEEALEAPFNYVTSKYMGVTSRYDITKLNFEICYMFRLLTEAKENEKYLEFDIPYVGRVSLFDAIVGLFALVCIKFGFYDLTKLGTDAMSQYTVLKEVDGEIVNMVFDHNIMDTTTKNLTILGFNFNDNKELIYDLLKSTNKDKLEHLKEICPGFDIDKLTLDQMPALYKSSPEVILTYLNDIDCVEEIYNKLYASTTIEEYNEYKKILNATAFTKYTTDMYRLDDGTLPRTYLEYIQNTNPAFYAYIIQTNDENMVDQIDNVLVALDKFMNTKEFEHLFLNIPSLSVENIRRFLFYLIETFKSYTIDLYNMNIVYNVDDKRIHNVKLILDGRDWQAKEEETSSIWADDRLEYNTGIVRTTSHMLPIFKELFYGNSEFDDEVIDRKIGDDFDIIASGSGFEKREPLPFDFSDSFSYTSKNVEHSNKINMRDTIFFIREEDE